MKDFNYTSNDPDRVKMVYAMIVSDEGTLKRILFEPSAQMIRDMRARAPRKVFED